MRKSLFIVVPIAAAFLLTGRLASADIRVADSSAEQSAERAAGPELTESCKPKDSAPSDLPDWLSFVPEMEPIPKANVPTTAGRWSDAEKAKYAEDIGRAAGAWKNFIPEIKSRLTPGRVRSLSRWAKTQMEQYRSVPSLEKVELAPVAADPREQKLVLEGTIDTLPSHHSLVTRWLKVYVVFDLRKKSVSAVVVTIRGQRLE